MGSSAAERTKVSNEKNSSAFGLLLILVLLVQSSCGPIAQVEYPDGPAGNGIAYMYFDRKAEPQSKAATSYHWVCGGVRYAYDVFVTVSSVTNSSMIIRGFTIVGKQNAVGVGVMSVYPEAGNVYHQSAYPDVIYENGAP
jgi:hypothetical protein